MPYYFAAVAVDHDGTVLDLARTTGDERIEDNVKFSQAPWNP